MKRFLTAFSRALDPLNMAEELALGVEGEPGGAGPLAGALVLATAASGDGGFEVGRALGERWPGAVVVGSSFEGVVSGGRIYRDEPAMALLAWTEEQKQTPVPFVLDAGEADAARISEAIFEASGQSALNSGDLVLLFVDAHHVLGFEEILKELGSNIAPACLAGAGASGIDGRAALSFLDSEELQGALIGLYVPAAGANDESVVRAASGSRSASPWLEISRSRPRWIDELDAEPALDWVRRQLGLDSAAVITPHLDRLLARVRRPQSSGAGEGALPYEERYIVGLDERRGSFSWPGTFATGDQLALALPDAAKARERLRESVEELAIAPVLLQFACRARDEALHGDSDLESAWVAHCAGGREVIGTVAPFQLQMSAATDCRLLVHSTILAALGPG